MLLYVAIYRGQRTTRCNLILYVSSGAYYIYLPRYRPLLSSSTKPAACAAPPRPSIALLGTYLSSSSSPAPAPERDRDRDQGREMPGPVVKTEWPELVGQPFYPSCVRIQADRPDTRLIIVDIGPDEALPDDWPKDYQRVFVRIDATLTVLGAPDYPNPPWPKCG